MPLLSQGKSKIQELGCGQSFFSEELWLSASVLFLPVVYMTAALALISRLGLGLWVFPTGLLLWGTAVVALHREEGWQRLAATLLLFLAAFALAAFLTSLLLDGGFDSRVYHAKAVWALLDGINPYWKPADWVTLTYPAAHWLLSSSLVLWTQIFGASFAFTLVAAFAAFLCARRFLATLPRLSRVWRNVLAFLLAAHPVVSFCFFTHYSDGVLVSVLLSVFMLMLYFVFDEGSRMEDKRRRLRTAFCLVALLVLLVNIKATGLVFGSVLGVTALAYGVRRAVSRKTLLRLAGLGSAAAILGIVLFGFYPYVTNTVKHHNPFHPATPFDKQANLKAEIIFEKFDPAFVNMSQYEQWWVSLFSKHGNPFWKHEPLPPFSSLSPFSFDYGYGSFFSGVLLLSLTLVFFVRHKGAWIVMIGVVVSMILGGISFAFRHTPQNWWLPILLLVFLLAPDEKQPPFSRAQKAMVFIVVACLLYSSVQSFNMRGIKAIVLSHKIRQAEREGGWFVVPDPNQPDWFLSKFFRYYKSGLSGVRLPLREECPEKAERRKPIYGLMLCKP